MTGISPHLRVLVVEDELLIRWSIAETLGHAGHTVIEAENGAAAVRALTNSAEPVDVVMLDYRLPDSNDLTLLAAVRRLSPSSGVILMTAHGTPEVTKGVLDLGAYQVMHKPIRTSRSRAAAAQGLRLERRGPTFIMSARTGEPSPSSLEWDD